MDISIIIVSYNTCSLLRDCIKSIYVHTVGLEFEIIVVDNDSKDGSCRMLAEEFPEVVVIASRENLGFGRANNLGMARANGKYLFCLNSDTILQNNALRYFFEFSETTKEPIGAIGAILKAPNGDTTHSYGRFITMGSVLRELIAKYFRFLKRRENLHPDEAQAPKEVDYITGADLLVPKSVYKELGGFDPRFFMYCEEVDWQRRMAMAGYKRFIIPGPEIVHLEGGSDDGKTKTWSPSRLKNILTSRRIYLEKYYSKKSLILFRMLYKLLYFPILAISHIRHRGGVHEAGEKSLNRAKYNHSLFRYLRIFMFWFCNAVPFSRFMRAKVYRILGCSIEKGIVQLGAVSIDSLHPEDVYIGRGSIITGGVVLLTHFYDSKKMDEHAFYRGELHIGRNCYIGMNTIFCKPVTVGDGVVIGAGSVVTKDIPPYQVWAGVPARFICNRYTDESEIPESTDLFKPC